MSPPPPDLDTRIAELVATWPPLDDEVFSQLAVLLRPDPIDTAADDHAA